MLSQQLAKGWEYLAQHLVLLPGPYPGCILFFTVAAENKPASVFYVRGTTLESAWREGATRVRQWAWSRKRDTVQLRIDWVQDVTPLQAGCAAHGTAPDTAQAGALAVADAGLERAELLHGQSFAATPPAPGLSCAGSDDEAPSFSAPPCLLLHLRGIYISDAEPPIAVPRVLAAQAPLHRHTWVDEVPLRAALALLLERQRGDGGWPGADDACDHLGLTYALLQGQRHAGSAALAQAIDRALGHLERMRPPPASGRLGAALALLVLARHFANACTLGPAAGRGAHPATLRRMDQQAEALLSATDRDWPAHGAPQPLEMAWAALAMHAYASIRPHTPDSPALRAARSALPGHCTLSAPLIEAALQGRQIPGPAQSGPTQSGPAPSGPAHPAVRWIGIALAESIQLEPDMGAQSPQALQQWSASLQRHVQSLRSRTVWPEQALYLPPTQRRQAAFLQAGSRQLLQDPAESARLLVNGLAGLQLMGHLAQALQPGAASAAPAQPPPGADAGPGHRHLPMRWEASALADAMQGRWMNLTARHAPTACLGVDASRQHHLPGAAVLVRRAGLPFGVPGAALPSVQAGALISSSPQGLFRHGLPVLHVPDLPEGLLNLARAARQRIKAPVVAVTGCAGKTSTLGMLRHCLQEGEDARADALLAQGTALQMVNWSETAPCALLELPLHALCGDLALAMPDILVITNIASGDIPISGNPLKDETYKTGKSAPLHEVVSAMQLMHKGSHLVIQQEMGRHPVITQAARTLGIRIITFGPGAQADVRETAFHESHLQVVADGRRIAIAMQCDGHHMALNAQAALGALLALGFPLHKAPARLAGWMPQPGAGQPQLLPNGICLLDHSMSNHLLSLNAAFSQLHTHAHQSDRRLIVLAGIQSPQASLDAAQLALEPLVRSAPARRVLLYGEPLRQLAMALADLLHVNWYDDLNQLICSLLRTMCKGDTVLLAGRASTNLAIAADAIRDSHTDRSGITISTNTVPSH